MTVRKMMTELGYIAGWWVLYFPLLVACCLFPKGRQTVNDVLKDNDILLMLLPLGKYRTMKDQ